MSRGVYLEGLLNSYSAYKWKNDDNKPPTIS